MAEQSINLHQNWYSYNSSLGTKRWIVPTNSRPAINSALTPSSNPTRLLQAFGIYSDGRVLLNIATSQTDTLSQADLSDAFETGGSLSITVGSESVSANLAGADLIEPYFWTPSNSSAVITFYNGLSESNNSQTGTLVIRDVAASVGEGDSNICLGSTQVTKLYLGSTEISKAYLGSTEIFS